MAFGARYTIKEHGWRWLVAASAVYGLVVGARSNLLFGAVALLVPVARACRERQRVWASLAAATIPLALIGSGLMLYNELRFGNPLEFGWRYQLNSEQQISRQPFSPHFLWFNFRAYFLQPARWSGRFPFVHEGSLPPLPAGYLNPRKSFGVLVNIPLAWLALVVPLAWRGRSDQTGSNLRWFVAATALLFGMCAIPLALFCVSAFDYAVDFLPSLLLLACVGILGLERALAGTPGLADRLGRRWAGRCGWGVLLGFSVAFNLLATAGHYAEARTLRGDRLRVAGKLGEAIREYQRAVRIDPEYARAQHCLGYELLQAGRLPESIEHFEEALRSTPGASATHNDLGSAFERQGRMADAERHYEQAVQTDPRNSAAHNNLANVLAQRGDIEDAIRHYEEALQIDPDYGEAHCNLGIVLGRAGRVSEAIEHLQQAVRIKPDLAEAQEALGRLQDARSSH
ncbi:MAG TPA: tetratricopeptide repeat protein [Verrucomicrobiae bacterium]|nr:tetratricopeptide repeat protein [Verrucomicrobiae bacterium]